MVDGLYVEHLWCERVKLVLVLDSIVVWNSWIYGVLERIVDSSAWLGL